MSNNVERRRRVRGGWFLPAYLKAFGIAALIGAVIGAVWVLAGLLHFHPLW